MKVFNKKDIIEQVAARTDKEFDIVSNVTDEVFNTLREIITGDDIELRIEIRDFGVFEVKKTNPRPKARNPKSKEIVNVPARRKTHFKPGKRLRKALQAPINPLEGKQ